MWILSWKEPTMANIAKQIKLICSPALFVIFCAICAILPSKLGSAPRVGVPLRGAGGGRGGRLPHRLVALLLLCNGRLSGHPRVPPRVTK